jgi:hypothetical protein
MGCRQKKRQELRECRCDGLTQSLLRSIEPRFSRVGRLRELSSGGLRQMRCSVRLRRLHQGELSAHGMRFCGRCSVERMRQKELHRRQLRLSVDRRELRILQQLQRRRRRRRQMHPQLCPVCGGRREQMKLPSVRGGERLMRKRHRKLQHGGRRERLRRKRLRQLPVRAGRRERRRQKRLRQLRKTPVRGVRRERQLRKPPVRGGRRERQLRHLRQPPLRGGRMERRKMRRLRQLRLRQRKRCRMRQLRQRQR